MKFTNKKYSMLFLLFLICALSLVMLTPSPIVIQNIKDINNPKSSTSEITLITPENKTYTEPASGHYPATYGFENDIDGSIPHNWNDFSGAGCSVEVVDEIFDHKKVVKLNDSSGNGAILDLTFPNQTTGKFEWWWLSTDVNNWLTLIFYEGGTEAIHVELAEGTFRYIDTAYEIAGAYGVANNSWYRNRIDFDVMDNQFSWNVYNQSGDVLSLVFDGYFRNTVSNIDRVRIKTHDAQLDYQTYVDAVGYSWDSSYSIGSNKFEGMLLNYDNNTNLNWQGYSLDKGANKTISGNTTIPMPSQGSHQIQLFGKNTMGTIYESAVCHFTIDTLTPKISISYPSVGQEFSKPPAYILTIIEENIEAKWYTLNGGPNIPFKPKIGVINDTAWNSLEDGPITLRFYITDIGDREAFDEVIVIKNTTGASSTQPPENPGYNFYLVYNLSLLIGALSLISVLLIRKRLKS
jgi:hypothetical protein